MKHLRLICAALLLSAPAMGQTPAPTGTQNGTAGNDITSIIRDILGETPFPAPPGGSQVQSGGIDNIPVSITIEDGSAFEGEWLVVSAFAPPKDNSRAGKGELLGQTRLLLRGLTPPLNIVIAAPSAVTEELDFARIEGRIENSNGNAVLVTREDGYFRGGEPALLTMGPKTAQLGPQFPPETIVKFERTQGKVDISKPKDIFRGAVLTVQLTETGLVGGKTQTIKGESRTQIDGLTPPFEFALDYGVPENGFKMPLTLSAYITDWAGRKTHVMAKALEYNGPDFDYRLTLDAYRQGGDVANFRFSDPVSASKTTIKGEAIFNAYKGLPLGSYMQVRLKSPIGPNGQPREISSTAIGLDESAGNVTFTIEAPSVNFDPELPVPLMDVTVFNSLGNALFESAPAPVSTGATNLVTLTPRSIY